MGTEPINPHIVIIYELNNSSKASEVSFTLEVAKSEVEVVSCFTSSSSVESSLGFNHSFKTLVKSS